MMMTAMQVVQVSFSLAQLSAFFSISCKDYNCEFFLTLQVKVLVIILHCMIFACSVLSTSSELVFAPQQVFKKNLTCYNWSKHIDYSVFDM